VLREIATQLVNALRNEGAIDECENFIVGTITESADQRFLRFPDMLMSLADSMAFAAAFSARILRTT